jgi:hypothetical protein
MKHDAASVTDISGATWAAITGMDGYYNLTLTTSHTDTEGLMTIAINDDSVCLPVRATFMVITQAAYASLFTAKATGYMDVDVKAVGGTTQTANDNGADINTILSRVTAAVATATALATAQTDLDTLTGSDGATLATTQGNYAPAKAGDAMDLVANAVDASALATDAVTEIWAKAMSDIAAGNPSATCSVLTAINYLYEAWRNQTETTATEIAVYKDDASTKMVESTISDDGTTFTKGEYRNPT